MCVALCRRQAVSTWLSELTHILTLATTGRVSNPNCPILQPQRVSDSKCQTFRGPEEFLILHVKLYEYPKSFPSLIIR